VTESADDDFDALIESAYAEPEVVSGVVGDDHVTPMTPSAPRAGVDRGVAGSLIQARSKLRRDRRRQIGPPWRDLWSIVPVAAIVACVVGLRWLITLTSGLLLLFLPLAIVIAVSRWVLYLRRGPAVGERAISRTVTAEQRVGRQLQAALAGSSWVLFHDRLLPHTEHRVPFLAVGPSGVALVAVLPPGPYLILAPTGVRAGDDELVAGWLPARMWEGRYLLQQLMADPARDLHFTGPVLALAAIGYDRASKIPTGWSVDPPHRIDSYLIRTPTALGAYLRYLPMTLGPDHVDQLARLIDQRGPPAPHAG